MQVTVRNDISPAISITILAKEPTDDGESATVPGGNAGALARVVDQGSAPLQEDLMGIPNDSVTQDEIDEKRRQEAREELREEQRRKAERSLDRGLEDSFPASDPPNITQPPPTVYDRKPKR
jgi:hypothetical protein